MSRWMNKGSDGAIQQGIVSMDDLLEELVGSCRRKPFALVCGSAEFTKDMAGYLLYAGLAEDSYFLF